MGIIDDKTKELERKRKKSNLRFLIIIVVSLAVFASLFLNGVLNKNSAKTAEEDIEIIKNQIDVEMSVEDSLRRELNWAKSKLKRVEAVSKEYPIVAQKIENLNASFTRSNVIPVYYYQRMKDGNRVFDILEDSENPIFQTELVKVYDDEGNKTVNTLYVGKNVKGTYVDDLLEKLKNDGIILQPAPYISAEGTEWKDDCLEIGFERDPSQPNKNADTFVRIYSYRPDVTNEIKKKIEGKLGAKGYQVRVFPDWKEKPSFFSNQNTILYYDKKNVTQAVEMAAMLTRLTRLSFRTKMGAGLGVLEKERDKVFIIHYNGSN